MSDKPFHYQDPFPLGPDTTEYELLTAEHVSPGEFEGRPVLKVAPEGLTLLAAEAIKAIAHDGLGQRDQAVSAARSAVAFFDEQQVRSPFRERLDRTLSDKSVNT